MALASLRMAAVEEKVKDLRVDKAHAPANNNPVCEGPQTGIVHDPATLTMNCEVRTLIHL